jgi:glycosyltransferase involved in cell wall biosynthesis
MLTSIRLGFHYHLPACQASNNEILTPGFQGRFIDSLAESCASLVCFLHSPLPGEIEWMEYTIQSRRVTLVNLGPHVSVPKRILSSPQIARKVRSSLNMLDAMLIRGPSPLLPTVASAADGLPIALLLVGDYVAGLEDLKQPFWRKNLIRIWSLWNQRQQARVARRSLTFVNNRKLYEDLKPSTPNLVEILTTTLTQADFFERQDTCNAPPYHLLYTGRIDRAKGILDMVEAIALLSDQGEHVLLDLVGWPDAGDNILEEILAVSNQLGVQERVIFHGYKALGPELFAFYRQADIYVIASRTSEGFPRTIWEAMAHSLPVVATRLGSIPSLIEGAAELVQPRTPQALAAGIARVLKDSNKRKKMIARGMQLARENTLEVQTHRMIEEIERWSHITR